MKKDQIAFILIVLLVSCSNSTEIENQATFEPTAKTIANQIASTPAATPTVAATATTAPMPTSTPVPTATTSPTPENTATPDIVATVTSSTEPQIYAVYPSPDGKLQAEITIYDCNSDMAAYEQLQIIDTENGIETTADSQLINCGGLGAYGLDGLFWSPNGRYFYYTNAREGVPDGCGFWQPPIIRLDTTNWQIMPLYSGSLSPDGTQIVAWDEDELVFWRVDGGEIARVSAATSNYSRSAITWSPDSQAVVYLQNSESCYPLGTSYIIRLDLPEMEQTLFLESKTPTFGKVIWETPDQIKLFDENQNKWQYDFTTKELKPVP